MFFMLLKQLIFLCIKQLHNQRSTGAVFHLLTGKRSIQTVQDAHLFGLDRFYGVFPSLSRKTFDQYIDSYARLGLLNKNISNDWHNASLTTEGMTYLAQLDGSINYFNGLELYQRDEIFYKRLLLLTQVLTNHYKNNSSYIPVIEDPKILSWMRNTYHPMKHHLDKYLHLLYDDLYRLLNHFPNMEAEIFVDRLSAYKHYGLSLHQISAKYELSEEHVRLLLRAIVHKMLYLIKNNSVKFSLLNRMINDFPQLNMLTQSAQVTYQLLNKQHSVEQIASIRRLKVNTIYDHLIEICWYDQQFPIERYVSDEQISLVKRAIQRTQSLQLKMIKQFVEKELSYFQIRLALTRIKNVFAEGEFNHVSRR